MSRVYSLEVFVMQKPIAVRTTVGILAVACLLASSASANPATISYQGQLRSNGALYGGNANLKFAILQGTTSLWSNDSTSVNGSQPAASVVVPVAVGVFTVQLGAPPMKPISAGVFAQGAAVLRVWASTGGAYEQLTPDQPITSVPFALQSEGWIASAGNVYRVGGNVGIGTSTPQHALDIAGTTSTRVLQITGGSDLAEPFDVAPSADAEIQPGMVVSIDPEHPGRLRLAAVAYDHAVAGVVSGANGVLPGLVMSVAGHEVLDGGRPVALSGRVWCWAVADRGAVQPGDLLTTSSTPGMAMVARDPSHRAGAILGKAMTRLERGRGLVLVLVSLQ
jgi:hypothetical protein